MSVTINHGRALRRPISLKLRARIESAVEQMLELLNELDGDPDLEPALAAPEIPLQTIVQMPDKRWIALPGTQERWVKGGSADLERDTDIEEDDTLDHGELDTSDNEPSLGWTVSGSLGGSDDHEV